MATITSRAEGKSHPEATQGVLTTSTEEFSKPTWLKLDFENFTEEKKNN